MAFIKFENKNIYYEIHGEGEPLVILNGIMMSHASWSVFIPELSKDNKVILLDFLDQGSSDKMTNGYKQDIQVEVVKAVLDSLNIKNANVFGISYGGEIALQFAIKYKDFVNKLMLFNTTSCTNPWLADIGRGWMKAAETYDPETYYNITIPVIYSPYFYSKNIEWMNNRKKVLYKVFTPSFLNAMNRLTESAEGYDVRNELKNIEANTLVVGSELDYLTPLMEQRFIHNEIKNSKFVTIENCGHASMYEKPNEFISLLKGFLKADNNIKIV